MKTYRAAIVGLTDIGAAPPAPAPDPVLGDAMPHSHAAAYAATARVQVTAVCDLVPDLRDRFISTWRFVFPEVRPYGDYREMLAAEEIDLLSVVTPDHLHADIVVDAVAAGVRGIFCEKPIATTLADADRMIAACADRGVPLLIDHSRRWYPEYLEVRRLIRSGEIGPIRRVVGTLGGPRAMLFRNGTHLIDAICFLADAEPAWLVAQLDDEAGGYGPRYAGDGGRDPATDPGATALIHFADDLRALISISRATAHNFELDVLGERGRIRIGRHRAELWRPSPDSRLSVAPIEPVQTTRGSLLAAVEELIAQVEHGGRGSSSGEDGRRVLSILLAILQSSHAGAAVVRFPVQDA